MLRPQFGFSSSSTRLGADVSAAVASPFVDRADADAFIFMEAVDIGGNRQAIVHRSRTYLPLKAE
jgi:hypothetical protein